MGDGGAGGGPGAFNMLFPGPRWLWAGLDSGSCTFPVNPSLVIGGPSVKHDADAAQSSQT